MARLAESMDQDKLLVALTKNLLSNIPLLGPILMTLSMILTFISSFLKGNTGILAAAIAISLGLTGGYLQFHTLILFQRVRDLALMREPNTIKYVGIAAFYTATYYIIIGSLLARNLMKDAWETVFERPVEDSKCRRINSAQIVLSLGLLTGFIAKCLSKELAINLISSSRGHIASHESSESLCS